MGELLYLVKPNSEDDFFDLNQESRELNNKICQFVHSHAKMQGYIDEIEQVQFNNNNQS